jgi:hypothetical protein
MQNDPIVEEVRRALEAYAAKFNYDLEAISRERCHLKIRLFHKDRDTSWD